MSTSMTLAPLDPRGTIDPDQRIAAGDITSYQLDQLCAVAVSDEVYDQTSSDIAQCYDGRPSEDEAPFIAAKAAGGVETRVVGSALAGLRENNETVAQQTTRVASKLVAEGHEVGGHTADTHGAEGVCGCGACDKLPDGLQYIAANHDKLAGVVHALGIEVDEALSQKLAENAANLLSANYVQSGPEIIAAIQAAGGTVEKLVGPHLEGAAVINTKTGTTLNKRALMTRSNGALQAFGVDVWAMQDAARNDATEAVSEHELLVAMLYYNLAIAAVLCGPGLRVVVR